MHIDQSDQLPYPFYDVYENTAFVSKTGQACAVMIL